MFQPRTILHPTDFSEDSASALRVARDVARQYNASLLVLHVADTLGPEKLSFAEVTTRLQPESHVRDLRQRLQAFAPPEEGLAVRHLLAEGDPAAAVQQAVTEHQCDLLVLGTHGRTGLGRLLMESNAERILRLCPCPVLVLKYPPRGKPA
jgi:nucleotide-binding universal stress UspA family protein